MDLFLDCTGGVDGQTVLAALAHLGMNFDSLEAVLAGSGMPCRVLVEPASGGMGMGCRIKVTMHGTSFPQDSMADLTGFMAALPLPEHTRSRVLAVMHSLQSAATSALGVTGESVLCDSHGACLCVLVPGICLGLEQLGVRRLTTSALPWPTEMPVSADAMPAPTAARLMQGKPVFRAKAAGAVVTPLGAALLDALADEFATGPEGVLTALGVGYAGDERGGSLRALLVRKQMEVADHSLGGRESVTQLETHLDHLNGEDLGMALTELMGMPEVLDVLWLPGVGKKNRPAGLLRVLCQPRHRETVAKAVIRHTHTLGLRFQILERMVIPRTPARLRLQGEALAAKRYVVEGEEYVRPEADELAEAARRLGVGVPALRYGLKYDEQS